MRRPVIAVLGSGGVGAAALPVWSPGIGWPIAAVAVATAAVLAGRPGGTEQGPAAGDRVWRWFTVAAAIALVGVAAVRAAGWLVALCVPVALALASSGLAGGRGWLGLVRGAVELPAAALRGMSAVRAPMSAPGTGPGRGPAAVRLAVATTVGTFLVVVFGALFWAADTAFADLLTRWFVHISFADVMRALLGFALLAAIAVGVLRARPGSESAESTEDRGRRLAAPEWAVPIAMLDVLFGVFVSVQPTTLFGGERYVLGPGGPDYAVYAKGGFGQLMTVTVLTLAVLAALAVWARRETRAQRALLRVLAGVLCLLTLVIVASALTRMGLYARVYGFTVARLLAYLAEAWLGTVFALMLVVGVRLRAHWLPRATVATGVALLLALAAINPEALMARTVLARWGTGYPVDLVYVSGLSADAVEELDRLPEPSRSCALTRLVRDLDRPQPWYAWNLARHRARQLLARRPVTPRPECVHLDTSGYAVTLRSPT